jgi:predicted ferric reductase
VVNGWRSDDGQTMSVEFTRALNTGDANDYVISSVPGTWARFMWTTGQSAPGGGNHGSSSGTPELSMHGYVGAVGQFRVDWAGGVAEHLTDGMEWPFGYWIVLIGFVSVLLLMGILLQLPSVQRSGVGGVLRTRPLLCVGRVKAEDPSSPVDVEPQRPLKPLSFARSRSTNCCHIATLQVIPTLRNMSTLGLALLTCYAAVCVGLVLSSLSEYVRIGRSWSYLFGHLAALHLALAALPVTRNSAFLWLCHSSFDEAIAWHRRVGVLAVAFTFCHLVSMMILWDTSVIFNTTPCQFGLASIYGSGAFIALVILFISSLECVRRSSYEWFLYLHIASACVAYALACLHSTTFRWLLLVPGVLVLFDFTVRTVWNPYLRFSGSAIASPQESASAAPSSKAVELVQLECHGARDVAILHDQILVVTLAVRGLKLSQLEKSAWVGVKCSEISHFQSHPFTISSARKDETAPEGEERLLLTLHILAVPASGEEGQAARRERGSDAPNRTFTQQLYDLAKNAMPPNRSVVTYSPAQASAATRVMSTPGSPPAAAPAANLRQPFTLYLDGPYGSLRAIPMMRYKVLVLVAGGIGVTPLMRIAEMIARQMEKDSGRVAGVVSPTAEQVPAKSSSAGQLALQKLSTLGFQLRCLC